MLPLRHKARRVAVPCKVNKLNSQFLSNLRTAYAAGAWVSASFAYSTLVGANGAVDWTLGAVFVTLAAAFVAQVLTSGHRIRVALAVERVLKP